MPHQVTGQVPKQFEGQGLDRGQVFTDLEHLGQQVLHLEVRRSGFDWRDVRGTGRSQTGLRTVLLFRDGLGGRLRHAGRRALALGFHARSDGFLRVPSDPSSSACASFYVYY